jgi:hypothetical protein
MTLDQVSKHFGGDYQAAIQLKVSYQTIRNWRNVGIPQHRQESIELRTGGKLKADEAQS